MENPINSTVFDSRDLYEYLESLSEELLSDYNNFLEEENKQSDSIDEVDLHLTEFYNQYCEKIDHYESVKAFYDELADCSSDFTYGETIIAEDYFEDYCEELLEDLGYLPKDFPSWIVIDWEATTDNIKQDYSYADFNGETYWIRRC